MEKPPAFQFYPKDYQSDENVMLMDLDQRGAYVDLLCHSWLHGSIPPDVPALARICRTTPGRMARLWPGIAPCWRPLEDGRLVNGRQERERAAQVARREVAAEKGKKGAEKRWPGHSPSYPPATDQPMPGDGSPSASATSPANGSSVSPPVPSGQAVELRESPEEPFDEFAREVRAYWLKERGSDFPLETPRDFYQITVWHGSGIPLRIVLRGMADCLETMRRRGDKPGSKPLAYYNSAVQEAARMWRLTGVGAA